MDKEFHILFVPRRTIECDEELDAAKVQITVSVHIIIV
jgi:hypothetical protein